MSFTEELKGLAQKVWDKELEHPFVQGLASGELPREKFQFYLRQDYLYLMDFCRVYALAAAKSETMEEMRNFTRLLSATLDEEMELHRKYAASFGISEKELESTSYAPTTHAYTRHLLQVAYEGRITDVVAAILPCEWGYHEIGLALSRRPGWESSPYADWIRTYISDGFRELVVMARDMLDEWAQGARESDKERWKQIFLTSSRYELHFWDMAYRQETWLA